MTYRNFCQSGGVSSQAAGFFLWSRKDNFSQHSTSNWTGKETSSTDQKEVGHPHPYNKNLLLPQSNSVNPHRYDHSIFKSQYDPRLSCLDNLQLGWDGEDAEVPNPYSRSIAETILLHLDERGIQVSAIMPCIDGGVSIVIRHETLRILIECYNSKDLAVSVVSSDLKINDNFALTEPEEEEVSGAIERIREFLLI